MYVVGATIINFLPISMFIWGCEVTGPDYQCLLYVRRKTQLLIGWCTPDKPVDLGFPIGGGTNPRGAPIYDFTKFCKKLHEIEKVVGHRGACARSAPLNPSLQTVCHPVGEAHCWQTVCHLCWGSTSLSFLKLNLVFAQVPQARQNNNGWFQLDLDLFTILQIYI